MVRRIGFTEALRHDDAAIRDERHRSARNAELGQIAGHPGDRLPHEKRFA
jgi:hypothetical protein